MGNEPTQENEEHFPDEARGLAERVHRPIAQVGRHLAVRHRDWTPDGVGEEVYMYTLCIMRCVCVWGDDSKGSNINRMSHVEAELEIST